MELKKVPLDAVHREWGAKMTPFAGYDMPVRYTSGIDEHHAVRNKAGIFDVSHMGEFLVEGEGAFDLIQYISSNNIAKLEPGKIKYSCLLNEQGGVVDDLLIYMLGENRYMLVVNAANITKDWEWVNQNNKFGAELKNISDDMALLAVQGPEAPQLIQSLTETDLSDLKFYTFTSGKVAGVDNILISATGYTGEPGFELYLEPGSAEKLWREIFKKGKSIGLQAAGLAARDTLRLEMGLCLYGNDITEETTPIEAGLGWATKVKKGDFLGQKILADQKENGTSRKLVAFRMLDKGIPRKDYPIQDENGEEIGVVTSGSQSPTLGYGIGMGYVKTGYDGLNQEIYIQIRKKTLKAETVKLPLHKD